MTDALLTTLAAAKIQNGDQFTIIQTTNGTISGVLNGNNGTIPNAPINNGSFIFLNGNKFLVQYSNNSVVLTAAPFPTTTYLVATAGGGSTVNLTATVSAEVPPDLGVGSSVTFVDNTTHTTLGNANLVSGGVDSGTASLATTLVSAGDSITATYTDTADTNFLTSSFTINYLTPPTVTAVSPLYGPIAGGTTVTITGTNFAAGVATIAVQMGGSNYTSAPIVHITGEGFGATATAVMSGTSPNESVPDHGQQRRLRLHRRADDLLHRRQRFGGHGYRHLEYHVSSEAPRRRLHDRQSHHDHGRRSGGRGRVGQRDGDDHGGHFAPRRQRICSPTWRRRPSRGPFRRLALPSGAPRSPPLGRTFA